MVRVSDVDNLKLSYAITWEQRKLGELGKATSGTSIESEFTETGKYKVISIGSYSETSKYTDQGIRATKTEKIEKRILNKNDLTMILNDKTASGNIIGRVLLIDTDDTYVYNQRTERIEVYKKEYLPEFLYQLLNADNIRSKIIRASQGNTQIYVNWSSISELVYEIPVSKEEQAKIAEFFTNLDHLITLHQRKYDKLVNVKKAMLKKMFPKDGSDVPEIRFKGFTEAWEQRKLSGLANETNGGGTPKTSVDSYWNGNIPWIQSSDIKENEVLAVDIKKTISQEAISNSATKLIPKNSIAIVTRVGVGKLAIIPFSYTTSQDFLSLSGLKTDLVFTAYLLYKKMQSDLNSVQGTAIKGITKEELLNKNILLPELAEQDLIGKYFQQLDNLITLHQRKLEKLKNLKKACLEKMFV